MGTSHSFTRPLFIYLSISHHRHHIQDKTYTFIHERLKVFAQPHLLSYTVDKANNSIIPLITNFFSYTFLTIDLILISAQVLLLLLFFSQEARRKKNEITQSATHNNNVYISLGM